MSPFAVLFILMLVGIGFWNIDKYPRVSKAGFVMFVVAFAAICYGAHPLLPGFMR
jgi:hypothetical protein